MDLMIDIETLATGPDAMVMTIAAQVFDPLSTGWPDRHFYARVTPESQPNRKTDDTTIEWWAQQGPEAQREVFEEVGRRDLHDCLDELGKLIWQSDRIWANGICFDMNILEHAFKEHGIPSLGSFGVYVMLELFMLFGQIVLNLNQPATMR